MTAQQVQDFANKKLEEISRHEIVVTGELPGETSISTRTTLKVVGTSTAFDRSYRLASIMRTLSNKEGFACSFEAKNHSTNSMVSA